ncbi:MAG: bifunctional oligoribonuclease/PAP phosphatase NrnA [Promethearchaeota archaeon]
MLISKFENLISFIKNKTILITTHDSVDIDGFVSCIVIKYLLNHHFNMDNVLLFFFEFSKSTRQFMEKILDIFPEFNFSYHEHDDISDIDVMLILDTNNLELINHKSKKDIPFIYIDHHIDQNSKYDNNLKSYNIVLDNYSSTIEILLDICELYQIKLPLVLKWLSVSAILTDSGFFKYGDNQTIIRTSKMLDNDLNIQDIFSLLKKEEDISERIAKIKGMQRIKLIHEDKYIIGVSNVSSYEASVANSMILIGFDISIVLSQKKSEYRITTRATKEICIKTGLHLGEILGEIANISGGNAGGHDGAASLNGNYNPEKVLETIIEKVKETINN